MKKGALSIFLILLIIPSIIAVEITFSKDSYQPQETLQAEITGNFISLTLEDIDIFKEGKLHSEPTIKDLTKQNNIYYFYAILPNQEGNFTFQINTEYLERGKIKEEPIKRNLTLEYKNTSDLSINPGFIIPNEDFEIKVKSLYKDTSLNAKFDLTGESKELSLIEGIEEILKFSLPESQPTKSQLTINSYKILVFLIKKNQGIEEKNALEFIPHRLDGVITENKEYFFTILLKNTGNNLTNISLTTNPEISITPNKISSLQKDGLIPINMTINIEKLDQPTFEGKITANTGDNKYGLPILFEITNNESEVKVEDATSITSRDSFSCTQLGNLCNPSDSCSGETISSLEGPCCIGECIQPKSSSTRTIIGIILVILLIVIIVFAVWKIRKRRKAKSTKQILNDKSNRFNKRMRGEEVKGGVDRI
ncbi:hypothetical protein CMI42_01615 [Candidatus Pacearchaeota archaeon]|nr:hypothetical protein [Candidatus Pacearchaeota archaeon]